ncbi:hypothetical protein DCAR_0831786 [Daucus carota subsp. sativus]|uniref:UBR-type domain-containing protein n=1 Tax=Daucus carota subsp. sativus TaxID=79200 RepID=A0AAF0XSE4_DAUCS|nr:PREDICTED: putative E3 ubiquitin-protein ligase UBR7 [Daucus carota subsp. sativus]WOH12284.1 hypothetical protein DCAR_0831786 [Daucus carota subsp. sativus]
MTDSFDEEAEPTYTIDQFLEGLEEQEMEADMVLGGDDGEECTYPKGYMKRQAIFSCLTCTPDGNAGVCTACSFSCHDGHDVVELWTKRNFRCDCGNSKFGVGFCKISPNKEVENAENLYNHNFRGRYCTCEGLYPDPDLEEQVEMIQCCICEDWFHEEHLGLQSPDEIPRDEEGEPIYEDFICQACSGACSFLSVYPQIILATCKDSAASKNEEGCIVENALPACGSSGELKTGGCVGDSVKAGCTETKPDAEIAVKTLEGYSETNLLLKECTKATNAAVSCIAGVDLFASPPSVTNKPMFLSKNWRALLCRCGNCTAFYTQKGVGFLLDHEDSIVEYEKMAKQKREEKLHQEETSDASFLNGLGHVEKIEILSGISDMKNELLSFMGSRDSSRAVTSDDIHQVFENLRKKRRTD